MEDISYNEAEQLNCIIDEYCSVVKMNANNVGVVLSEDDPVFLLANCFSFLNDSEKSAVSDKISSKLNFSLSVIRDWYGVRGESLILTLNVIREWYMNKLKESKDWLVKSSVIHAGEVNTYELRIEICALPFIKFKKMIEVMYN